jgi:tetraacyldisaccharide 4'-kinase
VSVGNLTVGGSGKTPIVAYLARLLLDAGERPAILSRGYGRKVDVPGVVVVRDANEVRAGLDEAGDEPFMLATGLPGACVLVAPDRYLAGRLAELRLEASVHVLDDGFQHFALARDVDLLVTGDGDLDQARLLPFGRLREPLDTAAAADAVIAVGSPGDLGLALGTMGIPPVYHARRNLGEPVMVDCDADVAIGPGARVLAVAGIARPERFFGDLEARGWSVAGRLTFPDHHPFGRRDVERIERAARAAQAGLVVTTEKDMIRLSPLRPFRVPIAWVPVTIEIEADEALDFRTWILERLVQARSARHAACDTVSST